MAESTEAVLTDNPELGVILEWLPLVLAPKNPLTRDEYKACCEHATALQVHGEGVLPLHLIKEGRPGEPEEITKYRMAIYQPFTLTEWKKARAVLMRIFQPGGFQIRFQKELPPGVSESESLQAYTETKFSKYYSLLNFEKDVMVQATLVDPNGIVGILFDESEDYPKPVPYVFTSRAVLIHRPDITIATSAKKSLVRVGMGLQQVGWMGYVWTPSSVYEFQQVGRRDDMQFEVRELFTHGLGFSVVRSLGGMVESTDGIAYYSSFFSGVIPHWNKAISIGSDFDGFLYKHLNPTLVRASMPCPTCRGVGRISVAGESVNCHSCAGTGYTGINTEKTGSPYQDITYDIEAISKLGMKASDLMTYVAPPVANFQEVNELIKSHIARGFGALNMEVVNQVGASQSGIAKAIDRQDLNGFLSECSEHFFAQLDWLYYTIAELRYRPLLGDRWRELVPTIIRPTKFDYVTTDSMLSEMERAKNAETHPAIIKSLNVQAAHRFLGEKSIEAQMVQAQITLDPYDGMTEDAILSLNASGVLRRDYLYIHANVAELVKRGMEQNPAFLDLSQKEQMDILMGFATLDLTRIDSTRLITPQGGEGGI